MEGSFFKLLTTSDGMFNLLGKSPDIILHSVSKLNTKEFSGVRNYLSSIREFLYKMLIRQRPDVSTRSFLWRRMEDVLDMSEVLDFESWERLTRKHAPVKTTEPRRWHRSLVLKLRRSGVNINGPRVCYTAKTCERRRRGVIRKAVRTLTRKC